MSVNSLFLKQGQSFVSAEIKSLRQFSCRALIGAFSERGVVKGGFVVC